MNKENQYERIFRALGDGHRLTILKQIAQREMNAGEVLETVDVVQSTLSHHMKTLCESGLVVPRKKGKWTCYTLDEEVLKDAAAYLLSICEEDDTAGAPNASRKKANEAQAGKETDDLQGKANEAKAGNHPGDLPDKSSKAQTGNAQDDMPGRTDGEYARKGRENLSVNSSREKELNAEPKAEEIVYTTVKTEDASKKKVTVGKNKDKEDKGKNRDKDRIKTKDKDKSKEKAKDKMKEKGRAKNREKGKDGRGKK